MNGILLQKEMWSALRLFAGLAVCGAMLAAPAVAQSASGDAKPAPKPTTYETLYLTHLTTNNDLNDVQTDLRNVLPNARIYGLPMQHAISIKASDEDLALAHKLVAELDVAKKTYRLTYSITDVDGGKKGAAQHYSLVVAVGEKGVLKQGTKVPIVTGSTAENASTNTQVQYIDVGLNIDASLDGGAEGLRLKTKIEQSSVADEKPGAPDPTIRQTTLEQVTMLTPGKALVIGAIDVPGGLKREEVEVLAELVK
jgi:type II secretory pathway component GspD/PulD (secretin)